MRSYCLLTVSILPWVDGLTFTPNSSRIVYNCTSFNAPNMGEWKEQEFSTWNEVDKPALLQFLTLDTYVCFLSCFWTSRVYQRWGIRERNSEYLYLLMALAGAHKGDIHPSNTYWMHITSPTHWQGDAEMKPSPCPPGSQCWVGRQARNPTRTTQQRFRACCVKTGQKELISGDRFLRDIISNPLDILLQTWNYAFILMYDGYVH